MNRYVPAVVAIFAAAGAVAYVAHVRGDAAVVASDRAAAADARAPQASVAGDAATLQRMQDEIARLSERLDRQPRQAQAPDASVPPETVYRVSVERAQAFKRAATASYAQRFDGAVANPARDAADRDAAERAIDSPHLATLTAPPRTHAVDCRNAMCRIDAEFASDDQADEWGTWYVMEVAGKFPAARYFLQPSANGGTRMQLYVFADAARGAMDELDAASLAQRTR